MIIRSQDKCTITDDFNLYICKGPRRRKTDKIRYFIRNNKIGDIADYSTEQKAIKVLDLLEKEYKNRIPDSNTVFQMPTDEELKV